MRAVLDTNVVVSATIIRAGNEDRVLRAWQRRDYDLVLSPEILEEIGRVLAYARNIRVSIYKHEYLASLYQVGPCAIGLLGRRRPSESGRSCQGGPH